MRDMAAKYGPDQQPDGRGHGINEAKRAGIKAECEATIAAALADLGNPDC